MKFSWTGFGMCAVLGGALFLGGYLALEALKPPSPAELAKIAEKKKFDAWLMAQKGNCAARRSNGSYTEANKTYECWRTPLMREPVLQFKAIYGGKTIEANVEKEGDGWTKFRFKF